MSDKESHPRWFILLEGVMGYTILVVLGLITNVFSEEFAVTLIEFLVPMIIFVAGAAGAHSVAKYTRRWASERGEKGGTQ